MQATGAHLFRANGHYSQAIVHAGLVYVSGQLGRGPNISDRDAGDIRSQAERAFAAFASILGTSGSDLSLVLKLNIYLSEVEHWPIVNSVCAEVFGEHRPARSIVPTGPLHFGALIEIDGIAALR